jgi:putative transposase
MKVMPSRNTEKIYAEDAYYHIYNRGVNKRIIFKDEQDYIVFLSLLKRHLGSELQKDRLGREYPNYHKEIKLLAFCLMPNHFHLLVFQSDKNAITKLLRSVCTAYTMYFNRKHKRVGHLFQGRFKASMITDDLYLQHISRYIHLNPKAFRSWRFSSLPYYLNEKAASWIDPSFIQGLFTDDNYLNFLQDYQEHQWMISEIKSQLANN